MRLFPNPAAETSQAIGDAVADAADRRRRGARQGGLGAAAIALGRNRQHTVAAAWDRARTFRAFLRIIRGTRRPFWQALHDDRGLSSGVMGRRQRSTDGEGAMLGGGASWGVEEPSPVARAKNDGEGENEDFRERRAHA